MDISQQELLELSESINDPCDIAELAAAAAAVILADNWSDTLHDGYWPLESILADIDDVVAHLTKWSEMVRERCAGYIGTREEKE